MSLEVLRSNLPAGLSLRPASSLDQSFLKSLFVSTRGDIRHLCVDRTLAETLMEMQFQAQTTGYRSRYPTAMNLVVENIGEPIGKVTIDFDSNPVHLVDIVLVPRARGMGYGTGILRAIQYAAEKNAVPVALTVFRENEPARRLYDRMGFELDEAGDVYDRLLWHPNAATRRG